jgi:hypothetical protein
MLLLELLTLLLVVCVLWTLSRWSHVHRSCVFGMGLTLETVRVQEVRSLLVEVLATVVVSGFLTDQHFDATKLSVESSCSFWSLIYWRSCCSNYCCCRFPFVVCSGVLPASVCQKKGKLIQAQRSTPLFLVHKHKTDACLSHTHFCTSLTAFQWFVDTFVSVCRPCKSCT